MKVRSRVLKTSVFSTSFDVSKTDPAVSPANPVSLSWNVPVSHSSHLHNFPLPFEDTTPTRKPPVLTAVLPSLPDETTDPGCCKLPQRTGILFPKLSLTEVSRTVEVLELLEKWFLQTYLSSHLFHLATVGTHLSLSCHPGSLLIGSTVTPTQVSSQGTPQDSPQTRPERVIDVVRNPDVLTLDDVSPDPPAPLLSFLFNLISLVH